MLLSNGSMIKQDVIECFDRAVAKPGNINADGSINWNFVDADMYEELSIFYPGQYIWDCMDALADRFEGVA